MPIFLWIDAKSEVSLLADVATIISALAWPGLTLIVIIWYRKSIAELMKAVVGIAESASSVKIWQIEFNRDVRQQLEASATEALRAPIELTASPQTMVEAPALQIQAASRVNNLIAEAPTSVLKGNFLDSIRERMLALAQEYESTRAAMAPGSERTQAMNIVAAKMRTLGLAAVPFLSEFSNDRSSPGKRLAAICILQMAPDLAYVSWLCERISVEQPFVFYQASIALLYTERRYGSTHAGEIRPTIERALEKVKSFSGNPDVNTVHTLTLALSELATGVAAEK